MRGALITFEGIDGAGKSTHIRMLAQWLTGEQGLTEPLCLREPGGTALGEALRGLLKDGLATAPMAELLLFNAARAELVESVIRPALDEGRLVLLDRFADSSRAYQGALGRLDESDLLAVCQAATGGLSPDLTLWLDLDPAIADLRINGPSGHAEREAGRDSIERRGQGYFARVRENYAHIAATEARRFRRVDADGSTEQVQARIRSIVEDMLKEWQDG